MKDDLLAAATLLQKHWIAAVTTSRASLEARLSAHAELESFFGESGRYCLNDWHTEIRLRDLYMDLARVLVGRLKRSIERHGASPEIEVDADAIYGDEPRYDRYSDDKPIEDFYLRKLAHAESRSLVDFANQLLETYPPEKAQQLALAQLASKVNEIFVPPHRGHPPRRIQDRGRVRVVDQHIYIETFEKWTVSSASRNRLHGQVADMAQLLEAAGVPGRIHVSADLLSLCRHGKYTSRQKVGCGPGLTLVLFSDKAEFQFAADVLDALQIAVATYLPEQEARAA